ncbi:hypothetical protein DERP_015288 [Dermatophagoides pteronyssinus]|uniref:Uncharacterized protein n=1 Tax=Dermatophagoides pteronyssinus TaxID=6956 RepID=A0ABQ8J5Q2_DERPT|nr:hypothetical protein DERP_015288 [Dermatophagoides pteronyssinus]
MKKNLYYNIHSNEFGCILCFELNNDVHNCFDWLDLLDSNRLNWYKLIDKSIFPVTLLILSLH